MAQMTRHTYQPIWLLLAAACLTLLLPTTCFTSSSTILRSRSLRAPFPPAVSAVHTRSMRLRGGEGEKVDTPAGSPRSWEVKDVLLFVEGLRYKFGERTDVLMEENDVDGKVLLGLSPSKLEQIGMKSLGHREFFTEQVLNLRSSIGLKVGPAPAEKEEKWESIERVAWDQEGRNVDLYLFLDGVGGAAKEDVHVVIEANSIQVKVKNLNGRNFHYNLRRLFNKIRPDNSFWKVKKDSICFKLYKEKDDRWQKLEFDAKDAAEEARMMEQVKGDPANAIVELMKGMYEGGDDDLKRTIAKAWTESQERQARGDTTPWRDRL